MNDEAMRMSAFPRDLEFDGGETDGAPAGYPEEHGLMGPGDLAHDGRVREHKRHQSFRDQVNCAMIGMFWILCTALASGIVIYSWHLMTPLLWHFLDDSQQVRLQTLLAPAVLSSSLTGYVSRRIE